KSSFSRTRLQPFHGVKALARPVAAARPRHAPLAWAPVAWKSIAPGSRAHAGRSRGSGREAIGVDRGPRAKPFGLAAARCSPDENATGDGVGFYFGGVGRRDG